MVIFLAIIIILILLISIITLYIYKKNIESFDDNTYAQYSKKYIIEDCVKNSNNTPSNCLNSAWVKNSKYLCGLCGENDTNPLYSYKKDGDEHYLYGCSQNHSNPFGLSWNKPDKYEPSKVNRFLGDIQTCNVFNNNATNNMYLYVCCDDKCDILLNNKKIISKTGWNQLGVYLLKNIKYGDSIKIKGVNTNKQGSMCVSYIWNKQLFILDNNGFERCANIINYELEYDYNITKQWLPNNNVPNLLPWMKNWISLKTVTNATLTFKAGDTQKVELLTNDLTVFLGIDDTGTVYLNNNVVYNKINAWNQINVFTVPNVNKDDVLKIDCVNGGGPGGIGIVYLWGGLLYTLPCNSLASFNTVANIISYTSTNCTGITYDASSIKDNLQFIPKWLNSGQGNFTFTTSIGEAGYKYLPSMDKWYTLKQNNLVGNWSVTNITNTSQMDISFTINIKTINIWRNIMHVSNQNVDCCTTGNRVPAVWVTNNTSSLYISMGTSLNGDDVFTTTTLPLNTPTDVKISWSGNNVNVYFNNVLNTSHVYNGTITPANYDAKFYIGDPWYMQDGGIEIKDFKISNT